MKQSPTIIGTRESMTSIAYLRFAQYIIVWVQTPYGIVCRMQNEF